MPRHMRIISHLQYWCQKWDNETFSPDPDSPIVGAVFWDIMLSLPSYCRGPSVTCTCRSSPGHVVDAIAAGAAVPVMRMTSRRGDV